MTGRGWSVEAWRAWCATHVTSHPGQTHMLGPDEGLVQRLTADTRTLHRPSDTVFFALHGPWHDGHDFLVEAHRAGVRRFVVRRNPSDSDSWAQDADVLVVEDVLGALQGLARAQRDAFSGPVLAVTGSNGKTTVKEWIAELLPETAAVHRSPLSHNSQLGVPMSVWSLDTHHDLSVVEAGISQPGEMSRLAQCIAPTEGVLTHLGEAHLGNFDDEAHLAREKCVLFQGCGRVFMPEAFRKTCAALVPGELVTWAFGDEPGREEAQLVVTAGSSTHTWTFDWQGERAEVVLDGTSLASVRNAATASLVALHHGTALNDLPERLRKLKAPTGRLSNVKRARGGVLIQDDCAHDLGSLEVALDALDRAPHLARRLALVGDVAQSGLHERERAKRILALAGRSSLTDLWMWVPHWSGEALEAFPDHVAGPDAQRIAVTCFQSLDDLVDAARALDEANVLVKVASHERLGAAVQALAPTRHVTTLTLNVSALVDNVRVLRSHVGAKGVIAVIKGLGYGTDPVVLGRLLEAQGVDWLAVAYADEGVVLREAGITSRILVLNPDPGTFDTLLEHRLEPQLVSLEHLELAHGWTASHRIEGWPVHLKLDTGMHRLGLAPHEDERAEELLGSQELSLATVMTHLAGADDPTLDERTRGQLAQFHERTQAHFPNVPAHVLNSAGAARVHEIVGDNKETWATLLSNIRVGLAMYGLGPGALDLGLQPVLSLETSVAKLVHVPARHGSGYGWTDAATHDRVLAVLSVGYADGYPRNLGNGQGKVLWKGRLLPTVGRVCMDMTTVDVTGLDVQPGDRVTLWGEAPRLDDLASQAKTIPYELLTRLGPRVQRVIVR